ncbi:MAG: hypothetical protein ICV70_06405 [Jiangellaceae bacterium]|nr:hypothetical protein [Jiangellaceae bacterium]
MNARKQLVAAEIRRIEIGAAAAAAAVAVLYLLIGFGTLDIGSSADGSAGDLLGFGLSSGGVFALIAVVLLVVRRRWIWILIALFDALVIGVYFAAAELRDPPFELWGLLIKFLQLLVFVAVSYLAVRGPHRGTPTRHSSRETTVSATSFR